MKREKPLVKRLILLIVVLAAIAAALIVTPTLARYIRGAADVNNGFGSVGSINPEVVNGKLNEDGKMEDVCIYVGKTGYPVYVRVEVRITWQKDGAVLGIAYPQEYDESKNVGDYTVTYNIHDWQKVGNYYYFVGKGSQNEETGKTETDYLNGVVKSEGYTSALIEEFARTENSKPPFAGYELNVEVIVQTVQAVGKTDEDNGEIPAWWDAWGFTKDPFNSDNNSGTGSGDTSGESKP